MTRLDDVKRPFFYLVKAYISEASWKKKLTCLEFQGYWVKLGRKSISRQQITEMRYSGKSFKDSFNLVLLK